MLVKIGKGEFASTQGKEHIPSVFMTKQCSATTWDDDMPCCAISVTSHGRLNSELLAFSLLTSVAHEKKKTVVLSICFTY